MNKNPHFDFTSIKEQALNLFKDLFWNALKRDSLLQFEELQRLVLQELGLPDDCPLKNDMALWFNNIYKQQYFAHFFQTAGLTELILHSNTYLQIQAEKRREYKIKDLSLEDYQSSLEVLTIIHGQDWNYQNPFVSFLATIDERLFRITLCHYSTNALGLSKAFFRKLSDDHFQLSHFTKEPSLHQFLKEAVSGHANIAVCGATGSGKTSFLRTLIDQIDPSEHLITIEDTHELISKRNNQSSLLADHGPGKSMPDYCRYALRMKPDRIIIGEIRGAEVVPFLLSSNSGHKGMMTSLHANNAADALSRLALLFQIYTDQQGLSYNQVLKLICQGLDYIIYIKEKGVNEIIKVLGSEGDTPYFESLL